jgi:hypothetical protein
VIDTQRAMPRLRWPAILAGVVLAVATTLLGATVLPPIPAAVASVFGLFISGLLAGKLAYGARVYHGAVVGAGYVICEALGIVPGGGFLADPVSDTVAVIVSDVLLIAAAALGGWSARALAGAEPPPGASSSDTDKAR